MTASEEVARAQRAPFKPFRSENVEVSAKVRLFRVDVVTFTLRYRHDNVVFLHTRYRHVPIAMSSR